MGRKIFVSLHRLKIIRFTAEGKPFHNYTYDLFTFHETSAFIIFLTKSWGLEKNISYGVCFGFLAQYFFLILNSWSNHSYFWNWKAFDITYIYLFVASFGINFFRWFILQTKACKSSKHAMDGWRTNKFCKNVLFLIQEMDMMHCYLHCQLALWLDLAQL